MFIIDEHESQAGNRSYSGVRVTDKFVIIEHIGHYHTFCYLNSIEMYAFNGTERVLIAKKDYDKKFYDAEFVRTETEQMLTGYMQSQLRMLNQSMSEDSIRNQATQLIGQSYTSMLDDRGTRMLEMVKPMLKASNNCYNNY